MLFPTLFALAAATLCVAAPAPAPAPAPVGPSPNDIHIAGFAYAGSGCPAGSAANISSSDKTILTLLYGNYIASIGPGVGPTEKRKNCQISLDVHYPQGWQYSIFTVDYRGFEDLDNKVTGHQAATYYFSGQSQQISRETLLKGQKTGNYLITDKFDVESVIWSPCGQNIPININSQVYLTSTDAKASGLLTIDSTDFKFAQVYHFQWRKC